MSSLALDSGTRAAALAKKREADLAVFEAGQKDTERLARSAPLWNRVMLYSNMAQVFVVFFIIMMASGLAEVFAEYWGWVGPAVEWGVALLVATCGGVAAYLAAEIAAKLPRIKRQPALFSLNLLMLLGVFVLSTIGTGALVLYAGESASNAGRGQNAAAEGMNAEIAIFEEDRERARIAALAAASALESARATHRAAAQAVTTASANLTTWQESVVQEFGQGTQAANLRVRDPDWPEHAARLAAIETAKAGEATARATVERLEGERAAADQTSEAASAALLTVMREQRAMASGPNNWERTWAAMGSFFGLTGQHFLILFGIGASVLFSIISYVYAYSNGAMENEVVGAENARAAKSREKALEGAALRAETASAGGGARSGGRPSLMASAVAATAPASVAAATPAPRPLEANENPAPSSDPAVDGGQSFKNLMERAMGHEDPPLPCGLRQSEYDEFLATHTDAFSRLEEDAEQGMLGGAGENALRKTYGGNDRAGKAYKHWLTLNGYAKYNGDGSIAIAPNFLKAAA